MTCTECWLKERCGSRFNFMKSICCTKYGNANVPVDFEWKVTENLPLKSMDRYRTQSHGSQTSSHWDTHDGDQKKISFHNCFLTFGSVALSGQVLSKMMNLSRIQLKCSGSTWKQRSAIQLPVWSTLSYLEMRCLYKVKTFSQKNVTMLQNRQRVPVQQINQSKSKAENSMWVYFNQIKNF